MIIVLSNANEFCLVEVKLISLGKKEKPKH